jgi:hypothetical protein
VSLIFLLSLLMSSCVTKTAIAASRGWKTLNGLPFGALVSRHDPLGNSHAAFHREALRAEVREQNANLASEIRIDRSGAVENGDPVAKGESAPGAHLQLETLRDCNLKSRRDEDDFPRLNGDWGLVRGEEIESCCPRRLVRGEPRTVGEHFHLNCQSFSTHPPPFPQAPNEKPLIP